MHSRQSKLYEVERIAGRRQTGSKVEFLVHWKGYDLSSSTWEPKENLSFCEEIVNRFVSKIGPIPGGIPCNISELFQNKKKALGVQLLLKKKRKRQARKMGSKADSDPVQKRRKGNSKMTETEKLIRDTLLHESKSISPNAASLVVNGLLDFTKPRNKAIARGRRTTEGAHSLVCHAKKRKIYEESSEDRNLRGEKRPSSNFNGISVVGMCFWNPKNSLRDAGEGDHIISLKEGNCMRIILNNTARHNVLTTNMMETIASCLSKSHKDPAIQSVIIQNNGDHFCSGIDYSELIDCTEKQEYKAKGAELCAAINTLTESLLDFPKPIMTAANGAVLEYGVALIALSDLTFTSSKTHFQLTFPKLNLTPLGCLTYLLPKVVGPTMAHAMMYLGESYRATAAYDRGLINDIYGLHSFEEDISKRIKQLSKGQIQVMEETKQMVRDFEIDNLRRANDVEMKTFSKLLFTEKCHKKLSQDWTAAINLFGTA